MTPRERAALDDHIAGGHYRESTVQLRCHRCDWTGEGIVWSEYGIGDTDPEDCPECAAEVDITD